MGIEQVENGTCDSTPYRLDVGDEVRVLEETAITAVGECNNIQVIKVQSISAPDVEGWVDQDAIDRLDPGSSCSP